MTKAPGSQGLVVSAPQVAERRAWTVCSIVALVAVCGAAGALAVRHLGTKPLWQDEAASLAAARRSAVGVLAMLPNHDADTGLYYVILHFWLRLGELLPGSAGLGAAWDRGLSVLFAVAAVAAAGWCAGRWRGPVAGVAAAAFLALNPFWLYYAQETRTYALALLLALVSMATLLGALERPTRRRLVLYGAASVLLLWADLFAVVFIGAQIGAVLLLGRGRTLARTWLAIAACTAPLAVWMLAVERYQIAWIPTSVATDLWGVTLHLGGGGPGLAAAGTLALVALIGGRRRDVALVLSAAAIAPPLALWLVSIAVPVLLDRYVIPAVAALVVLAGGGVQALWARRVPVLGAAAAVAVAAAWLPRDLHLEAEPFKVDDSRSAAAWIGDRSRPGDAIAYTRPGLRLLFDMYLPPGRPDDIALAPGRTAEQIHDLYPRERATGDLSARLPPVQRLWLVSDRADDGGWAHDPPWGPLRAEVAARLTPGQPAYFGAISIVLWSTPGDGSGGTS